MSRESNRDNCDDGDLSNTGSCSSTGGAPPSHLVEIVEVNGEPNRRFKILHWVAVRECPQSSPSGQSTCSSTGGEEKTTYGHCEVIDIDSFTGELKTSFEPERHRFPSFAAAKASFRQLYGDFEPTVLWKADAIVGALRTNTELAILIVTESQGKSFQCDVARGEPLVPVAVADYCQVVKSAWAKIPLDPAHILSMLEETCIPKGGEAGEGRGGHFSMHTDVLRAQLDGRFFYSHTVDLALPLQFSLRQRDDVFHSPSHQRWTSDCTWNHALMQHFRRFQLDRLCPSVIFGSVTPIPLASCVPQPEVGSEVELSENYAVLVARLTRLAIKGGFLFDTDGTTVRSSTAPATGAVPDIHQQPELDGEQPPSFTLQPSTSSSVPFALPGDTELEVFLSRRTRKNSDSQDTAKSPVATVEFSSQICRVGAAIGEENASGFTKRLRHITAMLFDARASPWIYLLEEKKGAARLTTEGPGGTAVEEVVGGTGGSNGELRAEIIRGSIRCNAVVGPIATTLHPEALSHPLFVRYGFRTKTEMAECVRQVGSLLSRWLSFQVSRAQYSDDPRKQAPLSRKTSSLSSMHSSAAHGSDSTAGIAATAAAPLTMRKKETTTTSETQYSKMLFNILARESIVRLWYIEEKSPVPSTSLIAASPENREVQHGHHHVGRNASPHPEGKGRSRSPLRRRAGSQSPAQSHQTHNNTLDGAGNSSSSNNTSFAAVGDTNELPQYFVIGDANTHDNLTRLEQAVREVSGAYAGRFDLHHVSGSATVCCQLTEECLSLTQRCQLLQDINAHIQTEYFGILRCKMRGMRYLRMRFALRQPTEVSHVVLSLPSSCALQFGRPIAFSLLLQEGTPGAEMVVVLNSVPLPYNQTTIIYDVPRAGFAAPVVNGFVRYAPQPATLTPSYYLAEFEYPVGYNFDVCVPVPLLFAPPPPCAPAKYSHWRRSLLTRFQKGNRSAVVSAEISPRKPPRARSPSGRKGNSPPQLHNPTSAEGHMVSNQEEENEDSSGIFDPFRSFFPHHPEEEHTTLQQGATRSVADQQFAGQAGKTETLVEALQRLNSKFFLHESATAREFALWRFHVKRFVSDPCTYIVPRPLAHKKILWLISKCKMCGSNAKGVCTSCENFCCKTHLFNGKQGLPNHAFGHTDSSQCCSRCERFRSPVVDLIDEVQTKEKRAPHYYRYHTYRCAHHHPEDFSPPHSMVGFDKFQSEYSLSRLRLLKIVHSPIGSSSSEVPFEEVFYGSVKGWGPRDNIMSFTMCLPFFWSVSKVVFVVQCPTGTSRLHARVTRGDAVGEKDGATAVSTTVTSVFSLPQGKKWYHFEVDVESDARGRMLHVLLAREVSTSAFSTPHSSPSRHEDPCAQPYREPPFLVRRFDVLGAPRGALISAARSADEEDRQEQRRHQSAQVSAYDFMMVEQGELAEESQMDARYPHDSSKPSNLRAPLLWEGHQPRLLQSKGLRYDEYVLQFELDKKEPATVCGIQFQRNTIGARRLIAHTVRLVLLRSEGRQSFYEYVVPAVRDTYLFPFPQPETDVIGFQLRVMMVRVPFPLQEKGGSVPLDLVPSERPSVGLVALWYV